MTPPGKLPRGRRPLWRAAGQLDHPLDKHGNPARGGKPRAPGRSPSRKNGRAIVWFIFPSTLNQPWRTRGHWPVTFRFVCLFQLNGIEPVLWKTERRRRRTDVSLSECEDRTSIPQERGATPVAAARRGSADMPICHIAGFSTCTTGSPAFGWPCPQVAGLGPWGRRFRRRSRCNQSRRRGGAVRQPGVSPLRGRPAAV